MDRSEAVILSDHTTKVGAAMLFIIYQHDKSGGEAVRAATRDAHFAYLDAHEDKLVLGGALLAENGITRIGSVLIVNVANREEALAFSENEPFRAAGLFDRVEINHMRKGQWNPEAAPKSAEGA